MKNALFLQIVPKFRFLKDTFRLLDICPLFYLRDEIVRNLLQKDQKVNLHRSSILSSNEDIFFPKMPWILSFEVKIHNCLVCVLNAEKKISIFDYRLVTNKYSRCGWQIYEQMFIFNVVRNQIFNLYYILYTHDFLRLRNNY